MNQRLLRILYVSFNVDVARNKSKGIKNTVESPEYQEIFPMVRLSKDRTSDELWAIDFEHAGIDVRGEDAFTVACAGLKGAITSKRSNLVVLDDLIKSTEAIKNPETRREMENNWSSVIQPTMFEGARAIALGTRFHFDDMFATTFTPEAGWDVMTQVALSYGDEGQPVSYWPEMWSVEFLLERQAQNRVNFAYQYQNQPVQSNELGMPQELFVKGQIPDTFDQIGVGIDLSSGLRERNDYTVFMLGGRLDDKAYIIDQRRIRCMGNIEKVEALCDLLLEWNLLIKDEAGHYLPTRSDVTIWPEEVSYQKSFQGDFRRIVFDEWGLTNLRVSPVRGVRGDKLARFRGVMGLFETGRVIFNRYRDFRVTFDEIMNLGHSPHDDCADALQILLDRLFLRGRVEME
jgi:phage terminase large subunit-like protein